MTEVNYTIAQLADFAKKGEIPEFIFAKHENARKHLLTYPALLKNHRNSFGLGLLFGPFVFLVPALIVYQLVIRGFDVASVSLVGGTMFVILFGIFNFLITQGQTREQNIEKLNKLASLLSEIVEWTGCTPGGITAVSIGWQSSIFESLMVERCYRVLRFQRVHVDIDPAKWSEEHGRLMNDIKHVYDTLLQLGAIAPSGYGRYFDKAKRQLDA